jgi:MoaD family protein, archaeal
MMSIKIKVRYFAFVKDLTGKHEEIVETTCRELNCLLEQLGKTYGERFSSALRQGLGGVKVFVLVNGKTNIETLRDGDEVAVLPPPAGGELRIGKLDVMKEIQDFHSKAPPEAGSMVVYIGFVKGKVEGHTVHELRYEAYQEYTAARLKEIEEEIKRKYNDVVSIRIIHAIDEMKPGDDVILIMVLGKGRKEAIRAIEDSIELVKHTTGIWKLEVRDDGEYWVVAGNTRVRRE